MEVFLLFNHNNLDSEKELFKTSDCYNNYLEIIKKTAILLTELNISNPFEISLTFEYLLWNGYFSHNHFLKYSKTARILNCYAPGITIMNGSSVCLDNADMLSSLLTTLKFNSKILSLNFSKSAEIQYSFPIEIDGKIEKNDPNNNALKQAILNTLGHIFGNHAISSFQYQDSYYFVDPTNLCFLNPYKHLNLIDISKNITMRPTFWGNTLVLNDLLNKADDEYLADIYNYFLFQKYKEKSLLTPEMVSVLNKNIYQFCENNIAIFEDFHTEIKPNIDIIAKSLKRTL